MAQMTSRANNQEARNALVDVQCLLEEMEDYLHAINTLVDQFNLFAPMASLMDGIGKLVDKMRHDMVIGNKNIYDVLENTKMRDMEVK